jgi:hypothetical protein
MFKKLLTFTRNGDGVPDLESLNNGHRHDRVERLDEQEIHVDPLPDAMPAPPKTAPFEQIYQAAGSRLPQISYGILKVREMADSPHLAGMSPDAKRGALLMALDAAGAQTEDLLQDAVARQRVLTDYEEKQQERLCDFEAAKSEANRVIQGELDRLTSQYMARIQANLDDIAQQQDNVHAWQKRKHQECQRIADTASLLLPQQGGGTYNGTLTAVLERASARR